MPTPDQPVPHLLSQHRTLIVDEWTVGGSYVDPEAAAITKLPAGPAVVMEATGILAGRRVTLDLVLPPVAELVDAFEHALRTATDPTLHAGAAQVAHDANVAAGLLPGSPGVHCPGCNLRLYGEVAVRGGCLTCYPDLGPLEGAATLDEKGARQ